MWNRFERIVAASAAALLVAIVEQLSSTNTTYFFSGLAAIAVHFIILKCWMDMTNLAKPEKNCWEFKE
jgi:hypothetical protein